MHVLSIRDLTPAETHTFLQGTHANHFPDAPQVTPAESAKIWDLIGGRMSFLGRLAKHADMIEAAEDMISSELEWLQHRLGIIPGVWRCLATCGPETRMLIRAVLETTTTMSWTSRK